MVANKFVVIEIFLNLNLQYVQRTTFCQMDMNSASGRERNRTAKVKFKNGGRGVKIWSKKNVRHIICLCSSMQFVTKIAILSSIDISKLSWNMCTCFAADSLVFNIAAYQYSHTFNSIASSYNTANLCKQNRSNTLTHTNTHNFLRDYMYTFACTTHYDYNA